MIYQFETNVACAITSERASERAAKPLLIAASSIATFNLHYLK